MPTNVQRFHQLSDKRFVGNTDCRPIQRMRIEMTYSNGGGQRNQAVFVIYAVVWRSSENFAKIFAKIVYLNASD